MQVDRTRTAAEHVHGCNQEHAHLSKRGVVMCILFIAYSFPAILKTRNSQSKQSQIQNPTYDMYILNQIVE